MSERLPPHNTEAEIGVLGSMILDTDMAGDIVQMLTPEDFYRSKNGIIYSALLRLYDYNRQPDSILLTEELSKKGQLEQAGGVRYIGELMMAVPSAAHGMYYAEIVRDKAILRGLLANTTKTQQDCYDETSVAVEVLEQAEQDIFKIAERGVVAEAVSVKDVLTDVMANIEGYADSPGEIDGLETGFDDVDNMLHGLKGGQLIIVAGRTSMGKTSSVLKIIEHVAINQSKGVCLFSMEMGKEQIIQNMLCIHNHIDSHQMESGALTKEQYVGLSKACERFEKANIYIDDFPHMTPLTLRAKARRMKRRHDIDLIVVDYVQLMHSTRRKNDNRQQEIAEISRALKGVARELNVPVIAVAQLNRQADSREGHRPRMSDLRESGALEQDADVVMLLYRPEYYKPEDEDLKNKAEVIIAKHRNGRTGTVKLAFIKSQMRFATMAQNGDGEERRFS